MSEIRLDVFLVEHNFFSSREKAKLAIKANRVIESKTKKVLTKPSMLITSVDEIEVIQEEIQYVSRGGLKLAAAIEHFAIDCKAKIALDIGASTGGFTDCLLQNGAKFVYALDVGTDQLVDDLKHHDAVFSMEQTNFRYIEKTIFTKGIPNLIVTDVSFISLTIIIDKINELFHDETFEFVALIKPQFELEKRKIGKKGVIHDKKLHQYAIDKIINHIKTTTKTWEIMDVIPSPITGSKGNQEFLIYIKKDM